MTELSGPSKGRVEDDVAEFRTALRRVREDHRRVLQVLVPRLVALQERGETEEALALISRIRKILADPEARPQ